MKKQFLALIFTCAAVGSVYSGDGDTETLRHKIHKLTNDYKRTLQFIHGAGETAASALFGLAYYKNIGQNQDILPNVSSSYQPSWKNVFGLTSLYLGYQGISKIYAATLGHKADGAKK